MRRGSRAVAISRACLEEDWRGKLAGRRVCNGGVAGRNYASKLPAHNVRPTMRRAVRCLPRCASNSGGNYGLQIVVDEIRLEDKFARVFRSSDSTAEMTGPRRENSSSEMGRQSTAHLETVGQFICPPRREHTLRAVRKFHKLPSRARHLLRVAAGNAGSKFD